MSFNVQFPVRNRSAGHISSIVPGYTCLSQEKMGLKRPRPGEVTLV